MNKRHKWTPSEIAQIREHKNLSAEKLKKLLFFNVDDISVKAIQRKKDQLRGEDLLRNNVPLEEWEIKYMQENPTATNKHLSEYLQRKPDIIDRIRHQIKRGLITINDTKTKIEQPKKIKIPVISETYEEEIVKGLIAIETIKNLSSGAIELARSRRRIKKDNSELVSIYDWFKVPQTRSLPVGDPSRVLMRFLAGRVKFYNRMLNNISSEKSAQPSTHQYNIIRLISGLRVTSWKNLNIHDYLNTTEMKVVAMAILDYCDKSVGNLKAKPKKRTIKQKID